MHCVNVAWKKKDIEDIQDREIRIFVFGFEGMTSDENHFKNESFMGLRSEAIFLDSSMVEHSAVNRVVVGSSPTRGAKRRRDGAQGKPADISVCGFFSGQKALWTGTK